MSGNRFLSKSRFKQGYDCPAKLYYADRPSEYANLDQENDFLKALADGGFQVGALAKLYNKDGMDLEGLRPDQAVLRTTEILKTKECSTIFEAGFQFEDFRVLVDIFKSDDKNATLVEVKSKSIDSSAHQVKSEFWSKKGLDTDWEPYLVDVAFQTYVARRAYPSLKIEPYLMLVDKSKEASIGGLHQYFRISKDPNTGRTQVVVDPSVHKVDLGTEILTTVPVAREVDFILNQKVFCDGKTFEEFARRLAENHLHRTKGFKILNSDCKHCEFKTLPSSPKLKSGFEECWMEAGRLKTTDNNRSTVFDLWDFRYRDRVLRQNKLFLDELTRDDLSTSNAKKKSTVRPDRQWLQIEAAKGNSEVRVNLEGLKRAFSEFSYPFHCIDFETATPAIPFHKVKKPFQTIAFQFSHHVLYQDGKVEHRNQFISLEAGQSPNFQFVRALRKSLANTTGTVFRYASHENTVLNKIRDELSDSIEPDRDELIAFIDSITHDKDTGHNGNRDMVDLRDLVVDYYYHPKMKGSNSIKAVVPAILSTSEFLRNKYMYSVYGTNQMPSLNFKEWSWIRADENGAIQDPYKLLPPVFGEEDDALLLDEDRLTEFFQINQGGLASTAWARTQFTEMGGTEREAIKQALLKYCELDTLAMVWVLEELQSDSAYNSRTIISRGQILTKPVS